MDTSPAPTVDVRAPNGQRVVLRPVISEGWIPRTSRGGLAVALVLCATWLATSFNRLNHTDLWGHLSFGRWIVEHHALPAYDPFRSFAGAERFLNVPWLSQVLGYLWYRTLGAEGLVLGHALLLTATAAWLMLAVAGRGVSASWAAAAAAAAYVLCLPIVGTLRPQVFGMLAFAGVLWAISQLPQRRHPLVWLPLLFALWANLHGSLLMGLAALGGFAAGYTWDAWRARGVSLAGKKWLGVARAWLALLLAAAGVCFNPLGVGLLPAVVRFSKATNLASVAEWRPTELASLTGALLLVSLALTVALVRFSPRRLTAWEVLLLVGFGYLATTSIRMLVWWGLLWPWVAAPHFAAIWRAIWPAVPVEPAAAEPSLIPLSAVAAEPAPAAAGQAALLQAEAGDAPGLQEAEAAHAARGRTLLVAVIVFVSLMWSPPGFAFITGRHRADVSVLSPDTPYWVAEAVVGEGISGRLIAPMDWADYLIWRSGGAVEPMVYTHVHLSGADLWDDFRRIESGQPGWLELADRYGLRYAVVSRARQPAELAALAQEPRCRLRYEDSQALLVEIVPKAAQ